MSSKRIYHIEDNGGGEFLVRATSKSQAINAAARDHFRAAVASQEVLVSMLSNGHKVREAVEYQQELPINDE